MFGTNLSDLSEPDKWPWPTPTIAKNVYAAGWRAAIEAAIKVCQEWRDHYPLDIFPDGDTSPELVAAKMARHVCSEIQFDLQQLELPADGQPGGEAE